MDPSAKNFFMNRMKRFKGKFHPITTSHCMAGKKESVIGTHLFLNEFISISCCHVYALFPGRFDGFADKDINYYKELKYNKNKVKSSQEHNTFMSYRIIGYDIGITDWYKIDVADKIFKHKMYKKPKCVTKYIISTSHKFVVGEKLFFIGWYGGDSIRYYEAKYKKVTVDKVEDAGKICTLKQKIRNKKGYGTSGSILIKYKDGKYSVVGILITMDKVADEYKFMSLFSLNGLKRAMFDNEHYFHARINSFHDDGQFKRVKRMNFTYNLDTFPKIGDLNPTTPELNIEQSRKRKSCFNDYDGPLFKRRRVHVVPSNRYNRRCNCRRRGPILC